MADIFTLKVITPERIFYEGPVTMVEFNTTEGEIDEAAKKLGTIYDMLKRFKRR